MTDSDYMQMAVDLAEEAQSLGEVPIGAVIVHDGKVIARAHNRRELDQDPVAHAELLAIRQAATALASWRLIDCTLYVTLEPCAMCAGALVLARVDRLVFGCRDPKAGAVRTLYSIADDDRLNHSIEVEEGVMGERCSALLSDFFRAIRERQKAEKQR